jgi:antitoxin PrlF
MSAATITSKGQITLPKPLRDKLNLATGDRIDFVEAADGRFTLVPIKRSIKSLQGCIARPKTPLTIEAMKIAIRQGAARTTKR